MKKEQEAMKETTAEKTSPIVHTNKRKIRDESSPMRIQGIIVEDPFMVAQEGYETTIMDIDCPNSVWSRSQPTLRRRLELVPEALWAKDPIKLRNKARPDETLFQLKFSFFNEYTRAQDKDCKIDENNVVRGVCSREYWSRYIVTCPEKLAFVVISPTDGLMLYKRLLYKGFERLNDILSLPLEKQQSVTVREPVLPKGWKSGIKAQRSTKSGIRKDEVPPSPKDAARFLGVEAGERTDEDSMLKGWPTVYRTTTKTTYAIDPGAISEIRKTVKYVENIVRGEVRHMLKVIRKEKAETADEAGFGIGEPTEEYAPSSIEDLEEESAEMASDIDDLEEVLSDAFKDDGEDDDESFRPKKDSGAPRKSVPSSSQPDFSDEKEFEDL